MFEDSKVRPILNHLAWLSKVMPKPINSGRAINAANLTYTAATMLQWRFIAPIAEVDRVLQKPFWQIADTTIANLVTTAEELVREAMQCNEAEDRELRQRLAAEIEKSLKVLAGCFPGPEASPVRSPEIEAPPNVTRLMEEYLQIEGKKHPDATAAGELEAQETGPEHIRREAIANLIATAKRCSDPDVGPELALPLTQMAAGFLITASEMQPDDETAGGWNNLRELAELFSPDEAA